MNTIGTIREFETRHFRVIVDAVEDPDLDLSFDETGEVMDKLDSGEYIGFSARARVIHDEHGEIASDYLGSCIYDSLSAFEDHRECAEQNRQLRASGSNAVCGSYFADMVKTVCEEARQEIAYRNGLNVYVRS